MQAIDFDQAIFLRDYWQQKPVVIRSFLEGFQDFVDAAECRQLALAEPVESRIVTSADSTGYRLKQGPFSEAELPDPETPNWTLLIQAAELWIPALQELLEQFRFLPSWRIDDVMVSYATTGGGVGPHFDHYDVFLVHGAGERSWKIGPRMAGDQRDASLVTTDSGLKLLPEMHIEHEVTLGIGEVLYIPPGYGHWGIAKTPGLCYSVGFRAPSQAEILEAFSDRLMAASPESRRFTDNHDLQAANPDNSGEISTQQWQAAWQSLRPLLDDPQAFMLAFGGLVTAPKYPEFIEAVTDKVSPDELLGFHAEGVCLVRNPASRLAYAVAEPAETEFEGAVLFADGENYPCSSTLLSALRKLCAVSPENIFEIQEFWDQNEGRTLICQLVQDGALWLVEPEDQD